MEPALRRPVDVARDDRHAHGLCSVSSPQPRCGVGGQRRVGPSNKALGRWSREKDPARWVMNRAGACFVLIRPIVEFPEGSAKASIYSLATNQSGTILAMGSPERVLRLYDPRSAAKLCKLVGHTDNVRALLLSDDGRFLLSASSDATVKLWSLGMQRCLHTFSYPSAGVWSLWSQHPSLEIFYSGDRAGYVCKVDLESCGDPSEGECAVLCKVEDGDPVGDHGERAGDQAINRIVGADDTFIWTATGSSNVQRWRDVRPRWERMTPFDLPSNGDVDGELTSSLQSGISPATLRNLSPPGLAHRSSSPGSGSPPLGPADRSALGFGMQQAGAPLTRTVSGASVAFADHATVHPFRPGAIPIPYSPTRTSSGAAPIPPRRPQSTYSTTGPSRPMSDEKDGLPLESLVPLEDPNDVVGKGIFAFGQHRDPESGTLYSSTSIHSAHSLVRATSIVSAQSPLNQVFGASFRGVQGVHRPSSTHTVDLSTPKRPLSPGADGGPSTSSQAWQLYQFRDTASEASPYRDEPDEVLYGRAGLLRCEMLNDRRHVVSIDTTGELALWDVIQGLCVGIFGTSRSVRERRPSGASSAASSTSSASSSRAVLDWLKDRLEGFAAVSAWCTVETHTGRLKVHLEEGRCFDGEVYADEADLDAALLDEMREDHRIAYGRWILRNLFEGFVYQQLHQRHLEVQQSETAPVPRPRTESIEPSVRFSRTHPPTLSGVAGPLNRQPFRRLSSALPHTPGMTIALATPAATPALPPDLPHGRTFDLTPIAGSPPNTTSNAHTPFAGPRHPPADYFSVRANNGTSPTVKAGNSETSSSYADLASTQSPITPTAENASAGFLSRFKSFGRPKRGADKTQDTDIPSAPPTPAAVDVAESAADHPLAHLSPEQRLQRETVDAILARPIQPCGPIDAPPLSLPPDMPILISEESHDSGAWEVTYRGLVRTTEDDMSMLEATMPAWLLELLLGNRTVVKEAPKVAFMLEPQDGMEKAGMQELPNRFGVDFLRRRHHTDVVHSNARLTASRILRMRKVAVYVSQKLELDHDNNGAPQAKRRASDSLHSRAPSSSSLAALGGKSPLPAAASTNGTSTPNSSLAATSTSPVTTNGAHRRAEDEIELLCNGQLVPWTMSLGAVKQFVWAKAGDVLIGYRAKAVPVTVASPV